MQDLFDDQKLPILLYLCHGGGMHVDETLFSILTALRLSNGDPFKYRIVVYTDNPEAFRKFPVIIEPLDEKIILKWSRDGYIHRIKTQAIIDALEKYQSPTVFLDSDTWLKQHPRVIFERLGNESTCLHMREAGILSSRDQTLSKYLQQNKFHDIDGRELLFETNAMMWNSGVIGILPRNAPLLHKALNVMDQVWASNKTFNIIEQFATGYFFERGSLVRESNDVVFHYWPSYLRRQFRTSLAGKTLKEFGEPITNFSERVYCLRPRPVGLRLVRHAMREMIFRSGFTIGRRRSG